MQNQQNHLQQYGTAKRNSSYIPEQGSGLDIGSIASKLGGMFGKGGGFEFGGGTGSSGGIASQLGGMFGGGSGNGLSSMAGKAGGSKMGYASAITPWIGQNDMKTGEKIGSSIGSAVGFYFGGSEGSAIGGWAGSKLGGLFS